MDKVLKSSRAFPLCKIDFHQAYFGDDIGFAFFVKKCEKEFDVLAFFVQDSYLCRYKFPITWSLNDVYKWLYQNGTFSKTTSRPFTS